MPDREEENLRLARIGDQSAFAALVRRYQGMVYNLALARLGDAEAAADATQEAFLRAWRGLSSFGGRASFSTWLYTIAYRTCLTMAGRRGRTVPLAEIPEPAAGEDSDPISVFLHRQEMENLRDMLFLLPPTTRAALVLYHFHNRSYEEIARITGEPLGTIRTHLHRGRAKLRAMLLARKEREKKCNAR